MNNPKIHFERLSSLDEAAGFAAGIVCKCAADAVVDRGCFNIALAGGSTPVKLHEKLTGGGFDMPWSQTSIYFGDERCVDVGDEASNFNMAAQTLISKLPQPPAAIYPMITGDLGDPLAAEKYSDIIKRNIPAGFSGTPQFDLVLLGIGSDGHTASLFPDETELLIADNLVVKTSKEHAGTKRISFTLRLINSSKNILLLAAGSEKSELVTKVFESANSGKPINTDMASQYLRPCEKLHIIFGETI